MRAQGFLATIAVAGAVAVLPMGTANAAPVAATGTVIVFSTEFQQLDRYENPTGCISMPPLAHIVVNLTNRSLSAYALPGCAGPPVFAIRPNYGVHTAGFGSVRVDS
jgi:hypothetical protein